MSVPAGFLLLTHLIEHHQYDHGGQPLLIPCIHEDVATDIELLAAGARRCGGALFNLNATDTGWEAPPGPVHTGRCDLVAGILKNFPDALPADELTIQDGTDGVMAAVPDPDIPTEPSLVPILRAAALVASSAYDSFEMVLTAVDLEPLDPQRRQLLWKLLTIDPNDLQLASSTPTTIAPILGTRVDPSIDYRRTPPVLYVTRDDRVLRRKPMADSRAVRTIGDRSGPLVLFLGAGASASSGVKLGNYYRDQALQELVGDITDPAEAANRFFDLLHERGHLLPDEAGNREEFVHELTLERVLQETFRDLGARPRSASPVIQELTQDSNTALQRLRPGRMALRELAASLRGQLVLITVNFDQLIETGLGTDNTVAFRPHDFEQTRDYLSSYVAGSEPDGPIPILKLHGSIQDTESLIATIDFTSAGLDDHVLAALTTLLDSATTPLRWVWVGCSMRDLDVNKWLGGLGSDRLDEWWVDPLPGASLDAFFRDHRSARWKRDGRALSDRLIIDSADSFLQALAQHITST